MQPRRSSQRLGALASGSPDVTLIVFWGIRNRTGTSDGRILSRETSRLGLLFLRNDRLSKPLGQSFWHVARYPICFTNITDKTKPHHLRICNVPVVFWHDGDAWHAAVDECPHRRVRLSEGRLEGSELPEMQRAWGDGEIGD